MKGPYCLHNPNLPIHGMGSPDLPQVDFADQIMREMLAGQPLGTYVAWAEQVSDVTWMEVAVIEFALTCVPITDALLQQVKASTFGYEVGWVGILFDQPATIEAIEQALAGTPYAYDSSLAVYDPLFEGTVPQIRFLVWARLRDSMPGDGGGGGSGSMDVAAQRLRGTLVYVIQGIQPLQTRRPSVPFQQALDAQIGVTPVMPAPTVPVGPTPAPIAPPGTPAEVPVVPQTPASTSRAGANSTLTWILLGGAAAAGFLWWYYKRHANVIPPSRQLPARGETGTY